jgi:hypothetical protein
VASAQGCTDTANGGKVLLNFAHAMAKVRFAARYISDRGEDFGIVVREIAVSGFSLHTSNTVRFTQLGFAWDALLTDDSRVATSYVFSVADNTLVDTPLSRTAATAVSGEAGTLLLLPQTIPTGAALKLTLWVGDTTETREIANIPIVAYDRLTATLSLASFKVTAIFRLSSLLLLLLPPLLIIASEMLSSR